MPCGTYFLPSGAVLALPRDSGDSRYPYGVDGFSFWIYSSGYMHGNEGLFSTFLRASEGQEPRIAFFAGLPTTASQDFQPISLLPVPLMATEEQPGLRRYTIFHPSAAYFITQIEGRLRCGLRVLVNLDKSLDFSLSVHNCGSSSERFFLSSYLNPHLRNQIHESEEDRWFKTVEALPPSPGQETLGSFLVTVHEDKDRHTSLTHTGVLRRALHIDDQGGKILRQETVTARRDYVGGQRSSLHSAAALHTGTFPKSTKLCTFIDNAVIGDLLHINLNSQKSLRLDLSFSLHPKPGEGRLFAAKPLSYKELDGAQEHLTTIDREHHSDLKVCVGESRDERLSSQICGHFFEYLKRQVAFCSLIKGYVQLSPNSLIGIRDIFQSLEGFLFWKPHKARSKMLEALAFTTPEGRCFRQYSLPTDAGNIGRMDLRNFIDQGVWVISTLHTYLCVTGDWSLLDTACGYHEVIDEDTCKVTPSSQCDSVLDHLFKIMDYLLLHRDLEHTGCVRALYGDWNDALDGLGITNDPEKAYGTGVSVMATLQVYQNTQEMISLLSRRDPLKYASRIEHYQEAAKNIEAGLYQWAIIRNKNGDQRILHGWGDQRTYLVGSFNDPDGQARDGLTSNAFWVLSGLHARRPSMRTTILDAFRRLDSKYGLKTFEPAFPETTAGVGRIAKLPPGTAENGATYVHATAFGVMALFALGEGRVAWEQLIKILPFTARHTQCSRSPFVMPNSYGYNPDKGIDGQSMNDWQTGSSNVILKALIRFAFGYEPQLEGVWIQPAGWQPFKTFTFSLHVRDCDVTINYQNTEAGFRTFTLNGKPHQGVKDPHKNTDKLWVPYETFKHGSVTVAVTD